MGHRQPFKIAEPRNATGRRRVVAEEAAHREAFRRINGLLANMSHELRTPLNAIIGFANVLHKGKAGALTPQQLEYLGDILASSKHLLRLLNDVLDFAKVESGTMPLRPEPVNLPRLVDEVRVVLRGLAAAKTLTVDTTVDPDVTTAVIDPARVKQILYNYLSNAIKFTADGGRIHVRVLPADAGWFRIDVEDTGIGIRPSDFGKLFIEFQQLEGGTTKGHQGTGLGLALAKRLAEAHGGHVAVQSTPGGGSTFSAILPRATAAPAATGS